MLHSVGVGLDELLVRGTTTLQIVQQSVEQRHVRSGAHRQMQVGAFAGGCATRIDDYQFQLGSLLSGQHDALEEYGVAPGGIRSDQHNQIRQFQILVTARDQIPAKGPLVTGYRGRHAEPRVGVYVGAADEALHQLVGDVVVLRQQLSGDVQGHRVWTVFADYLREPVSDMSKCLVPADLGTMDLRMQ